MNRHSTVVAAAYFRLATVGLEVQRVLGDEDVVAELELSCSTPSLSTRSLKITFSISETLILKTMKKGSRKNTAAGRRRARR
jgi:hypothetical protein